MYKKIFSKIKYFYMQKDIYKHLGTYSGKVQIKKPFDIFSANNVHMDQFVYIGPHAYWDAKGGIYIGKNVIFGPKSIIWTYNHDYKSTETIPYGGEDKLKPVIIEDNVWIGIDVKISPGVRVGEGAIVAMGSVVTKDIPSLSIVGGNPAEVISFRSENQYNEMKNKRKLYLIEKYGE